MARTQVTGENILDESVKGADIDESTLEDTLIPFTDSEFDASNIHDAIIEAKDTGLHANFSGLQDDDHLQYIHTDGRRDMDAGYEPENDLSLVTKKYVDTLRVQTLQFQLLGQWNSSVYLFSGVHSGSSSDRESGNAQNGYRYQDSAPKVCGLNGSITTASLAVKGVAISTATPDAIVVLNFELWKVGFQGEGTKIGNIVFNIDSSSYTVGAYYNSSIDSNISLGESQTEIEVTEGELLGLKFISTTGSANIISFNNATVVLEAIGVSS